MWTRRVSEIPIEAISTVKLPLTAIAALHHKDSKIKLSGCNHRLDKIHRLPKHFSETSFGSVLSGYLCHFTAATVTFSWGRNNEADLKRDWEWKSCLSLYDGRRVMNPLQRSFSLVVSIPLIFGSGFRFNEMFSDCDLVKTSTTNRTNITAQISSRRNQHQTVTDETNE